MAHPEQQSTLPRSSFATPAKLRTLVLALLFVATALQAQTFQVLHSFTGGRDGAGPLDGVTIDRGGNLYGTASAGGNQVSGCGNFYNQTGCGSVFKLVRSGSNWILDPLYDFQGGADSGNPNYGVTIGPDGALYGITLADVFRLRPPPTFCASITCSWQETVLHQFSGPPDASGPGSRLISDSVGNMYGIAFAGGVDNDGAAYELSPSGGNWNENVIYSFERNNLGLGVSIPEGQLAIDPSGNLYGAANCNTNQGCFYGAVWQLQTTQGSWTLNELYQFNGGDGYQPIGILRDPSGNLFGATFGDGGNQSANVYELTPSNGGWNYSVVYNYGGFGEDNTSALVMDSAGNLYGANSITGLGYIFKLTPSAGGWTFTTLHTFNGSDGEFPSSTIVVDDAGNLYGTTIEGGTLNYGVVWEITP